ncbi:MAG TPA: YceI family protein [Longimicrobiales bacterium]
MRKHLTLLATLALFAATPAGAQQYAYAGGAASGTITLSGGSTVRDWSCAVTAFDATVRSPGSVAAPMPNGQETAAFNIPVNGIDCRNRTMNGHLREALHGERHPNIQFELTRYTIVDGTTIRAQGNLTVGGRATPIEVAASYTAADGTLRVHGTKSLRMTELGVRPPTLMLGTLKVDDEVTITFDLTIRQSAVTLAALDAARGR